MTSEQMKLEAAYLRLRDEGADAVEAGRLEDALELFEQARFAADETGSPQLIDRAYCNHSMVAIELRQAEEGTVGRLRQILVRNQDAENCRLAAYHIAEAYKLRKAYKKALFYAKISLDRSRELKRTDWLASSHNRIGNILLAESYFEDACSEYEQALTLAEETPSVWRARIWDNVGYCRIIQGRHDEGFDLLHRSLRALRRFGAERFLISTHLDLCFAYLEIQRSRHARRHGETALALAEKFGETDSVKNALFLLGDVANLDGDGRAAHGYFSRLQNFYPDAPFLRDFLFSVNVRGMINLKA